MIRRNVELEARLIDDLLDLTRISKGKVQLSLEIVDAHVLLRSALEICQSEIDHKASHARAGSGREASPPGSGSRALAADLLEPDQERGQVYSGRRPAERHARRTMTNGNLRVEVADSGCGIDAESLAENLQCLRARRARAPRRTGSWSRDQQGAGRDTPWPDHRRKRGTRSGRHFHRRLPAFEHAAATSGQWRNVAALSSANRSAFSWWKITRIRIVRSLSSCVGVAITSSRPSTLPRLSTSAADEDFDVLVSDIGLPDGTGVELMRAA